MGDLYGGDGWLAARALLLVPVILSLTVHEFAHAWTARRLGDDTAERQGRLTLNPLEHIDPLGLLLPLLGVPFGWAKPVPIDPSRFSRAVRMETGLVLTAAAGPLSNLAIAIGTTLLMALWVRFDPAGAMGTAAVTCGTGAAGGMGGAWDLLHLLVLLNLVLALFNLLPIVPLDGSRIAEGLMPRAWRPAWNAFAAMGSWPLFVVFLAPFLFGVSVIGWPLARAREFLDALFVLVAG